MGRTWPNVEADRVETPGYYWNERLKKLARLHVGAKLPRHVGPWQLYAHAGEGSSSEIVRRLFDEHPGLDVNDFTYTTRSPMARRLPIGDAPPHVRVLAIAVALMAAAAIGAVWGRRTAG